ncbi:PREDICTED: peptidoglycan-recognition protein 2-like [Polistes canadensis]|uniref:peptidoglycan-recognition protein 2-like n=1 Tax=Polistes canadensis TaxID=91411 RepID=UPI000718AE4B|nr:PREDICTED: peptidoglycan-recognition protein 2-like [Polistes canadensis]
MIVQLLTLFLILHVSYTNGDCPNIISKSAWGGRGPKGINYLILPLPNVIIHHTVTPECNTQSECSRRVQSIQSYHMDTLGWHDIGYNFLIGGDGNVYEGAGWTKEGAHTLGYNKNSLGIGFIGNFEDKNASNKMVEAAHKLFRCGVSNGVLRDNIRAIAARQVSSTLSPGYRLSKQMESWPEWIHGGTN